jgi:hypothetical protein
MKLMVILLCAVLLASCPAAWAGLFPEETGPYHCRCKGQQKWILFIPYYGEYCGSGYRGGSQGDVFKNISFNGLKGYVGSANAQAIKSGAGCRYLPKSGWNCGKGEKGVPPSCIHQ